MSPLKALIRARIADTGPVTVAEFMELALGHPEYGYYMKGDPFGIGGDFITAPEISQIFGEMIGLWAAVAWQQIGRPERTILIECGPGRGTLMSDFLRAAKTVPEFRDSIDIHLVENSPAMRSLQRSTLTGSAPTWHDSIDTVPAGPAIVIANEFLDALPIRQFVKTGNGWAERRIDFVADEFTFVPGEKNSAVELLLPTATAVAGTIFETCPAALEFADELNRRMKDHFCAALFIDYGRTESGTGETLQAVRDHKFAEPLSDPGDADLTAHVDFTAFTDRLRDGGARTLGPVSQSEFLHALGISERTDRLLGGATAAQAKSIRTASQRLTDPGQMGNLFRVMVAIRPETPTLAGFERWAESQC